MRAVPLLALLALAAVVLPVAQKAVVGCHDDHPYCKGGAVHVTYRLFALNAMQHDSKELPGLPATTDGSPHWYWSPIPHETGRIVMLWSSIGVAAAAVATCKLLDADARWPTPGRRRRAMIAYTSLVSSIGVFAVAVAWNSYTWRATGSLPLMPHVGALALASSLASGLHFTAEPADAEGLPSLPPPAGALRAQPLSTPSESAASDAAGRPAVKDR